ncbi:TrkA family potassium uptake protein [Candidatus Fermentibacteria bacterium]|nr:TrkA family potassium uptake protein [Candidatus Fermentibacteria bacterium]
MFVIVCGAGLVGQEITKRLVEHDHDVVVIDVSIEVCEHVYAKTGAVTVHGSATDIRVLREAGVERANVLLCLMRNDSDNIACATLAKSLEVPRILARMRDPGYEQAYKLSGVTTIVRVADLLINQILVEIEQPTVREIMSLGGGLANVFALRIPPGAWCVGKSIQEIVKNEKFPAESLLMGIYRDEGSTFLIPRGQQELQENDTVFVISKRADVKPLTEVLTETGKKGLRGLLGKGG